MGNVLKSIKRMRLMAFLIIIQLSISLVMINETGSIIEGYIKKIDGFTRSIGSEKNYILRVNDPILGSLLGELKQINIEADVRWFELYYHINDFNDELVRLKNEGVIKNIFYNSPTSIGLDVKNILNEEYKVATVDNSPEQGQIYDGGSHSSILVNYDFINHYKLPIYEGRGFTKEDFDVDYKTEEIPIIIGKGYNQNIKIGDVLEHEVPTEKYLLNEESGDNIRENLDSVGNLERIPVKLKLKVIGFYDDDGIPGMFAQENLIKHIKFSNTYIIIPCIKGIPNLSEVGIGIGTGAYVEVKNSEYIKMIKAELEPKLKEKGLELLVIDLDEEAVKIKEVMARDIINSGLLGLVLMILSIIGITSVLLGTLNIRKREFGIRIASGATIKTLCKEMILEIMLMVGVAAILALIKMFMSGSIISLNILLINIGVMGIITLIISTIPIMRLRKMNPVDLVRGK